jgi:dolichol-phosphate mannosyltransferase
MIKPKIVVVIPTYNEVENIGIIINKLNLLELNLGFIIVDDSSPDGTADKAIEISRLLDGTFFRVIRRERKSGIAKAYIQGFTEAINSGADIIIQMDADLSHPPEKIKDLVIELNEFDVVIASRYISEGGTDKEYGIFRLLLSKYSNFFIRIFLGIKVFDITSGYKGYKSEVLKQIDFKKIISTGYIFQSEMIFECNKKNFKMKEIPYVFRSRNFGNSKLTIKIIIEAVYKLFLISLKK